MTIKTFECPDCAERFRVTLTDSEQVVACPHCRRKIRVPAADVLITPQPAAVETSVPVAEFVRQGVRACARCEGKFRVTDQMLGSRIACPLCGQVLRVEGPDSEPPSAHAALQQLNSPILPDAPRQPIEPPPGAPDEDSPTGDENFEPAPPSPPTRWKRPKHSKEPRPDDPAPNVPDRAGPSMSKPVSAPDPIDLPTGQEGKQRQTAEPYHSTAPTDPPESVGKTAEDIRADRANQVDADAGDGIAEPAEWADDAATNALGIPVFEAVADDLAASKESPDAMDSGTGVIAGEDSDGDEATSTEVADLPLAQLPPTFDVFDPERVSYRDRRRMDKVVLPDSEAGEREVDQRIVHVWHKGEWVPLVARTPEEQLRYRFWVNTISIAIGLVAVVIAILILLN